MSTGKNNGPVERARGVSDQPIGSMIAVELAFASDAFKCLFRALDPVLMFIAVGRHQPNDLESGARPGAGQRTGGITHALSDRVFMSFQQL